MKVMLNHCLFHKTQYKKGSLFTCFTLEFQDKILNNSKFNILFCCLN